MGSDVISCCSLKQDLQDEMLFLVVRLKQALWDGMLFLVVRLNRLYGLRCYFLLFV